MYHALVSVSQSRHVFRFPFFVLRSPFYRLRDIIDRLAYQAYEWVGYGYGLFLKSDSFFLSHSSLADTWEENSLEEKKSVFPASDGIECLSQLMFHVSCLSALLDFLFGCDRIWSGTMGTAYPVPGVPLPASLEV